MSSVVRVARFEPARPAAHREAHAVLDGLGLGVVGRLRYSPSACSPENPMSPFSPLSVSSTKKIRVVPSSPIRCRFACRRLAHQRFPLADEVWMDVDHALHGKRLLQGHARFPRGRGSRSRRGGTGCVRVGQRVGVGAFNGMVLVTLLGTASRLRCRWRPPSRTARCSSRFGARCAPPTPRPDSRRPALAPRHPTVPSDVEPTMAARFAASNLRDRLWRRWTS